jgi:hypothetical protein
MYDYILYNLLKITKPKFMLTDNEIDEIRSEMN